MKRFTNLVCGGGVILCAVLSILNILESLFDLVGMIRQLWNGLFGTLMIMMQLNVMDWITRRFGFLTAWFGRGMFSASNPNPNLSHNPSPSPSPSPNPDPDPDPLPERHHA